MIKLARALEQGVVPPGVDEPHIYRQRSGEMILSRTVDWWDAYEKLREGFVRYDAVQKAESTTGS